MVECRVGRTADLQPDAPVPARCSHDEEVGGGGAVYEHLMGRSFDRGAAYGDIGMFADERSESLIEFRLRAHLAGDARGARVAPETGSLVPRATPGAYGVDLTFPGGGLPEGERDGSPSP